MNHREIIEQEIVERYVLGKLSESLEAAFEEHYFNCEKCFHEVREMEAVVELVKRAEREEAIEMKESWLAALGRYLADVRRFEPVRVTALALVAAVIVLAYPAWRGVVLVPRLQKEVSHLTSPSPNAVNYFLGRERGAKPVIKLTDPSSDDQARFFLNLSLFEDHIPGTEYNVEMRDSKGDVLWRSGGLKPDPGTGLLTVACVGSFFSPGDITVVAFRMGPTEGDAVEVARYTVKLEE